MHQRSAPTSVPADPRLGAPDEDAAPSDEGSVSVYVHFPWCLSKCPYCDFVAFAAPREAIDGAGYREAVLAELSARDRRWADPALDGRRLASIFFGGGTPSLWGAAEVRRVIEAITRVFSAKAGIEISLECDPSSLDEDVARALCNAGVNRLSIGVQALDDERLRFLGRIHTSQEARASIRAAVNAGVPRVSADLMYAVAGQTAEEAAREATELAELGATHVSAYSLTIESDTPFGKLARRGRLPLCEDAAMVESFFAVDEALGREGLAHYEVSNYARPGAEARHNLGYWRGREYLGLGCGAYGTLRSAAGALRYRNQATPRSYLRAVQVCSTAGVETIHASEERLDGLALLRERIMLGLRMREGVDLAAIGADLGLDVFSADRERALAMLQSRGRIVRRGSRISVPREAWIWADDTAATLF
jgi:putative oxygen-independent coproporphyrinogen III oxidase